MVLHATSQKTFLIYVSRSYSFFPKLHIGMLNIEMTNMCGFMSHVRDDAFRKHSPRAGHSISWQAWGSLIRSVLMAELAGYTLLQPPWSSCSSVGLSSVSSTSAVDPQEHGCVEGLVGHEKNHLSWQRSVREHFHIRECRFFGNGFLNGRSLIEEASNVKKCSWFLKVAFQAGIPALC